METASSFTSNTATPSEPRGVSEPDRSVIHLADRQTASSCKPEAVISRLGGSVWGALAGRGLGEEAVINLQSELKETSANAAKDQSHFTKGRGIDTRDVVGLKEERE